MRLRNPVAGLLLLGLAAPAVSQVVHSTLDGAAYQDQFGWSVAGCRDVDADGRPDYVIGALRAIDDGTWPGRAYVISGADGSVLHAFKGVLPQTSPADFFGLSVAGPGDVDNDGHADIAVGAPRDDVNGERSGAVWLFSGKDGSVIRVWRPVDDPFAEFGWSVGAAGDVDSDGVPDVIAGAHHHDVPAGERAGSVWILSGASGDVIHTLYGDGEQDRLGYAVAGLDDLNGDGHAEFATSALEYPAWPASLEGPGYVRLHDGLTGAVLFEFTGNLPGDTMGSSLARAGDVDGDGVDDLLIGAQRYANGDPTSVGAAFVRSGADGQLIHEVSADSGLGAFGASVATAGDLDGDGLSEFLVGAPDSHFSGTAPGVVRLHRGSTAAVIHDFSSDTFGEFGRSVAAPGDLEGDGWADFVIGEPWGLVGAAKLAAGRVSVVSIPPPVLISLTPTEVAALDGGTLTVQGTGFGTLSRAEVGGLSVPEAYLDVYGDTLWLPAPPAPQLGGVEVVVMNLAGPSEPLTLEYVPVPSPVLVATPIALSAVPFEWTWAGPPDASSLLLVSVFGGAVKQWQGWPILAAGWVVAMPTLDEAGIATFSMHIPPAAVGISFHSQAVIWDEGIVGSTNVTFSFISN